jgi:hypothetical protein
MKLAMMIVDSDHADDIERMCEECDVPGYTKIVDVLGKGIAALDEHCIEPLKQKLTALRDARGSEEGLKAFIMNTEELL